MPAPLSPSIPLTGFIITASLIIFSLFVSLGKLKINHQQGNSQLQPITTVELIEPIQLPQPRVNSQISLEKTLKTRRSRYSFIDQPLTLKQVSQLLWSAQGITVNWGGRTVPSVKSAYPLSVYLLAHNITDLNPGLYRYLPGERQPLHQLMLAKPGNFQEALAEITNQHSFQQAPAVIIIAAEFAKMAAALENQNTDHYVYLEAGHSAQNLYLQAESLSLGLTAIANFSQDKIKTLLNLPDPETIIYLLPVGIPQN